MLISGLEYVRSEQKLGLDRACKVVLRHPARLVLKAAAASLPFKTNGANGIFFHPRRQRNGQPLLLPKLQTMRELTTDCPTDHDRGFNKNNPRIVSRWAHLLRDLAIDELPQLELLPVLSMVGPRTHDEDSFDFYKEQASKIDKGLANS